MEGTFATDSTIRQKSTSILIGFCVTFALMFSIFEIARVDEVQQAEDDIIYESSPIEEDMIPVTRQEEVQPAAPVAQPTEIPEIIDIVPDEVEIRDEKIETTEETNQVIIGTVGTGAPTAVAGPPVATGPVVEAVDDDRIFDIVEKDAEFPGGVDACYKWLSEHIKYPSICQEQGIQGRVFVNFVVNKDGSIVDVKVTRSPDDNLSKEAIRVVKLMPKWKPARQGNKSVRARFNLPVNFRLN